MTLASRLTRLVATLGPRELVLVWLDAAHDFGDLDTYARWLVEQPVSEAPLERIPKQVTANVRAAMRGRKAEVIAAAVGKVVADVVFRIQLVIELEVKATEVIVIEALRYDLLCSDREALAAEAELARAAGSHRKPARLTARSTAWRDALADLLDRLAVFAATVRLLEDRYLDGHAAVFPDTVAALAGLRERAEALLTLGDGRPAGPRRRAVATDLDRDTIEAVAPIMAERLTDEVRVFAADSLRDVLTARAITARLMAPDDAGETSRDEGK